MIFGVIGGLALFLYGMGLLSDGLKLATGERLRRMLAMVTKWPLVGLLIGAGVTCVIQSSSGTSVMVVGLINAGLLTLKQGISVILGANIGTTITGWLVATVAGLKHFKISTYAMPFLAVGFILHVLARRPRLRTTGQILLAFGGDPHEALRIAVPFVLGDNIGTTITAQLAALRTNISGKRAAMAHTVFNVTGVLVLLPFVYFHLYNPGSPQVYIGRTMKGFRRRIAETLTKQCFLSASRSGTKDKIIGNQDGKNSNGFSLRL